VDSLLILDATDIRYLSGSTEGVGALLFDGDWSLAFTTAMFRDRVPRECPGSEIRLCTKGLSKEAAEAVRQKGCGRVGIQENSLTLAQYRALAKEIAHKRLQPIGDVVRDVRSVKDDGEVRLIRRAVRIAEKAFRELVGLGAGRLIGATERELAAELEHRMRLAGADAQAFPQGIIVGSGPNSAGCHHRPTSRRVRWGEPVLFDWGAEAGGYRSDITRVVFVGSVPPRLREVYHLVLAAHDVGVAAMRPGVRTYSVDTVARGLIRAAGYEKEFRHGIGHGIGLQVHEGPGFGKGAGRGTPLRKNMVVTVEPGIYLDGIGGIRIEDDILITADGHQRLNSLPRTLERMILR